MTAFIAGGPERYAHQRRGLAKMIKTKGVTALLFEPGTGKTAPTIDFSCLLALKSPTREARVLVLAPMAAVDTWVLQLEKWASPQVSWWAEVVGGNMKQKGEALAARGGNPYKKPLFIKRTTPPKWVKITNDAKNDVYAWECTRCQQPGRPSFSPFQGDTARPEWTDDRWKQHLADHHPEFKPKPRKKPAEGPRALHWNLAEYWGSSENFAPSEGPDGLGQGKPRLVVEIINMEALGRRDAVRSKTMADVFLESIKKFNPDLVVIDESHLIRGGSSNLSRLAERIGKVVPRRIILTGTVMPTSPMDIWAQWRFLDPYAFGQPDEEGVIQRTTRAGFQERYAITEGYFNQVTGYQYDRIDEMQDIMERNAVVARKEQCLDLPPTQDVIVPVVLSPAERRAYAEMKKKEMTTVLASGREVIETSVLTRTIRLRQITAGFIGVEEGTAVEEIGTTKVDVIRSIVTDQLPDEKRIVIFTVFAREQHQITEALAEKNTVVMSISGATPIEERSRLREQFGSDSLVRMIMVAQIRTMSVSVNELVSASHAIFASLSTHRDEVVQARARLDRIGQKKPVTFWLPLAPHTVDEVIYRSHEKRTNLENALLEHLSEGE